MVKNLLLSISLFVISVSFSQVTVSSLADFQTAVTNSNQTIILTAGDYELEDLPSDSRVINCSGSNNTIILTGANIMTLVGSIRESYFIISGSNNIVRDGKIEDYYKSGQSDDITDYSAYNNNPDLGYGLKGSPVVKIYGNNNQVLGLELIVRGSYPYGYGSIYGIGSDRTYNHSKRCGLLISGINGGGIGNILDGITMYHNAFGHGIYIQNGADQSIIRNCYVEGRMRPSADLYNDTNSYDYPFRSNFEIAAPGTPFAMPFESAIPIPTDVMYPLSEDGIRSYGGTGSVTVENCTVKQMRGGIRTYLASSATVTNCTSTGCGLTNFNVNNSGEITQSSGDFSFAPIMDVPLNRSGQDIELTIIPSPNAFGPHNIADVDGNSHNITFYRTPGPLDEDEERAIVVTGNNSTIVNKTEYTIVIESGASGNNITSCGPVIDNGSNNTVILNDCTFDLGTPTCENTTEHIEAECFDSMNGIDTEDCDEGGLNIGFINNNDWAMYSDVDLTNQNSVKVRLATRNTGGSIEFRIDSIDGDLLGTMDVPVTGNWQNWETVSINIQAIASIHDVYLIFKGGGSYLYNMNWFGFSEESIVITDLPHTGLSTLTIYPNPTSGIVHLSESIDYEVTNSMGQVINAGNGARIILDDQPKGLYMIHIGNTVTKIIKQ